MRPPICAICDKPLEDMDKGGLIYFAKRDKDLEWDKRAATPGFVGHPPYAEWFCAQHYEQALKLKHLPLGEAIKEIKA